MKIGRYIASSGCALFALFFGAGNLVYPTLVGQLTLHNFLSGALGICISDPIIVFIAAFSALLYKGNNEYFSTIGKKAGILLMMLIMALVGPIGAIPRCILSSYGAFRSVVPGIPAWAFSAIFSVISFAFVYRKSSMIDIVGSILTPALLMSIMVLFVCAFFSPGNISQGNLNNASSFTHGVMYGYGTMDLLAGFLLGNSVIQLMTRKLSDAGKSASVKKSCALACIIGGGLLSVVYFILAYIGAKYGIEFMSTPKDELVMDIAYRIMGNSALITLSVMTILACLTTIIGLTEISSDFLRERLPTSLISDIQSKIIILTISFFASLIGFDHILSLIASIMNIVYPAFIVMTFTCIVDKKYHTKTTMIGFWGTFVITCMIYLHHLYLSHNFTS